MIRRLPCLALVTAALLFAHAADAQYKARPVITSLTPASGPPGTLVTINGQNFGPEYAVEYNGVPLQPQSLSATQIVVQLPGNAVQGRFTLRGPVHQVVSPQVFWVVQARAMPVITSIEPTSGPPGTVVNINGNNFSDKGHENAITISGATLSVRSATTTRIQAVIPVGATTGNITVQVYNAGQATSPQAFTVLAQLMIGSFEPAIGPPGTQVVLKGSGFSAKKNDNTVKLGDQPCKIVSATPNEIVVTIPKGTAVSGRFNITVKGLGTYETPTVFPVAYPPEITSFSPAEGNIGTQISIKGAHFGNNPSAVQLLLTGRACQILSITDKEILAVVPQGAVSGQFKLIVQQMGTAESKGLFEVWAPLAVTRMEPMFGMPGTEVKLYGTGFRAKPSDHALFIGPKKVAIESTDGGALSFKIPPDVPDGALSFKLEVADRGATMIPIPFTVMHSPEIHDFTPLRGPVGTAVVINGNYFGTQPNHVRILMNGMVIQPTAITPTQVMITVPPGAVTGSFEVQTVRRGNAVAKKAFEVFEPVRVTSFLPSLGTKGQTVHLFGSGFAEVAKQNTVTMNGVALTVVEATPTRLKVKLGKGVSTGTFKVEVPGRGVSETMQKFNVVEELAVKSFEPASGVPGALVTIKGKGFENAGLRGYIGQAPMGVRVDSPTQVTIAIPPNAETGKFSFTAPGAGKGEAATTFKVLVPLVVTGFQPAYGPSGTKVSIYGSGFDLRPNRTKVNYGRQALAVENGSTETMLVVTIPKGAEDSAFAVKVKDRGTVESENLFSVVKPLAPAPAVAAAPPAPTPAAAPGVPAPAPSPYGAPTTAPVATPAPTAPTVAPPPTTPASMDDMLGIAASQAKIDSVDPEEAMVGDLVMIMGSGFGEDASVVKAWVGNVPATVLGVLPDMIQIEVPAGVRRGAIKIKIGDAPMIKSTALLSVAE